MNRFLKSILYIVYFTTATGFFLYFQFPSETFMAYLSSHAEAVYPGIRVSMRNLSPTLPPGISITSGAVRFKDLLLVDTDTIRIRPVGLSLFGPDKQVRLQGDAFEGRFDGTVHYAGDRPPMRYRASIGLSGMEIGVIPILKRITDRRLSGTCDGRIEYEQADGKSAKISAQVRAVNCKVSLGSPVADAASVSLHRVLADFSFQNGQMGIKEILFKGRKIDGRLTGQIAFKMPVALSVLKLAGEMKADRGVLSDLTGRSPKPPVSDGSRGETAIKFNIEGTIEKPIFSF